MQPRKIETAHRLGNSTDPALLAGMGRVRWTICAMLFAATSINYMDRFVLGLLKPTLHVAIGLNEINYGHIISAFQVSYAIGLIVAGRLVDKLGSRVGYSLVMGTWSLAAMGHALARSAFGFGVARCFLGLGESGNFPAAIKTVAEWFPQRERSLATGIFNSGANVGAMVAPLIVPWVTLHYGWRAAFLATGVFSAAWIFWWSRNYRKPADHPTLTSEELRHIYDEAAAQMGPQIPWLKLLTFRQTWGFAGAKFLTDPIWWFYLFWMPSFFDSRFHLGLAHLGLPLIVVYSVSTVGSIGGGWLPAFFIRMKLSAVSARLTTMLLCAGMALPLYFVTKVHSEWAAIALLSLAAAAHQGWSANLYTTASDMFPSTAVGSVVGLGGMAGAVGGALFAELVGRVLQATHSYGLLFAGAASAYVTAFIVLQALAPGLKRVNLVV